MWGKWISSLTNTSFQDWICMILLKLSSFEFIALVYLVFLAFHWSVRWSGTEPEAGSQQHWATPNSYNIFFQKNKNPTRDVRRTNTPRHFTPWCLKGSKYQENTEDAIKEPHPGRCLATHSPCQRQTKRLSGRRKACSSLHMPHL